MVLTKSYGAQKTFTSRASMCTEPLRSTFAPNWLSSFIEVSTSFSFGTFWISTGSSASSAANRIGSAAFLAPEIVTSPRAWLAPEHEIYPLFYSLLRIYLRYRHITRSSKTVKFAIARPFRWSKRLNRHGMNAVVRNVLHQRAIDRLLFLDPAHAFKHLTHGNNLKVTAVARNVDFPRESAFISTL